jgi:hypothetical protein
VVISTPTLQGLGFADIWRANDCLSGVGLSSRLSLASKSFWVLTSGVCLAGAR